ncbi:site-specific DNA-methyltransferase [Sabulilitoribacter arenilitoris]|uniref:Site-specific DNA-methyltransferase n=1 Tax=Wocania arenilitoris TaxID=2044858 RepID=A0AAE3JLT9_9FLAO|nr:DNA methyltransferase [Wocania arenilitoris]MCF7569588.1 site-specific DNA-methyltransferase [Wocania arenilitoris]
MSRISVDKIVLDNDNHTGLLEDYKEIITRLIDKYDFVTKDEYKNLVNFSTNKEIPIHSWYDYKQGYARNLVASILEDVKPDKNLYVLDPFCGVGTTNLVAKELGYNSIGTDINPMAYFASKVKLDNYSINETDEIRSILNNFDKSKKWKFNEKPKVVESSFIEEKLESLQRIKGFIDSLSNIKAQNILMLAYLSIIEDASIRVKDGNGLKLKKNKKQIENIYDYFLSKCNQMLHDIATTTYSNETNHLVYNSSILIDKTLESLTDKKVGISIFSPPYANCFDYCEVYKLEFWLGGFVDSYKGFAKYRSIAMRSHVNSKFNHTIQNNIPDVDSIANLISTYNIWNKNIPDMLRGYFDDMFEILQRQATLLVKGGKCFIVVANSGYKGIMVPTDLLICDIAEKTGYKVNNIFYARKIRASGQQTTDLHLNYDKLMRESIIELELL